MKKRRRRQRAVIEATINDLVPGGRDLFVVLNGVRIAKRGYPDTPQARTWISLEPGYAVYDDTGKDELIVEFHGKRVQ